LPITLDHDDLSEFSSISSVETGTLAIATIWKSISIDIYVDTVCTTSTSKSDKNDPTKPITINIFLLFILSERFPHTIKAGTDAREEIAETSPTNSTLLLR